MAAILHPPTPACQPMADTVITGMSMATTRPMAVGIITPAARGTPVPEAIHAAEVRLAEAVPVAVVVAIESSSLCMFSWLKPKAPQAEFTFKARVEEFWQWFSASAERFYQTIEDKRCGDLTEEVSAAIDLLLPGISWVFGPGENGGHSFTLTGEGNAHRQFLARQWLACAPPLPGWTFYSSRQPSDSTGWCINLGEHKFDANAFWLTPDVNTERERVDLTVWHPLFPELDNRTRWTVLFLFLDEVLGEIGTQTWIGQIEMNDTRLSEAIPLAELGGFIAKTENDTGWKKFPPGEAWTSYQCEEPEQRFARDDILVGTTCAWDLIGDYAEAEGELEDPLAGFGADYVYVQFPKTFLPVGREVDTRGEIEDALEEALAPRSGLHLGGALGLDFAYIDLLIFDGSASLEIIRQVLQKHRLPKGTLIDFFAKEHRARRIVL